jgi:hypothetical protein
MPGPAKVEVGSEPFYGVCWLQNDPQKPKL